jgi:hypothetical protein
MEPNWKFYKDTKYLISNAGLVKNSFSGKLLKNKLDRYGYPKLTLSQDGKSLYKTVHRLVAETWIPNTQNLPQVNHMNGVKTDFRVSNLEWITAKGNIIHSIENGLINNANAVKLINIETKSETLFRSIKDLSREIKIYPSCLMPLIKSSKQRPILDKYVIVVLNEEKMFDLTNTAAFGREIFIHDCLTGITTSYPSVVLASYHTELRYLGGLAGFTGCDYKAGYYISFNKDILKTVVDKTHTEI